MGAVQSLEKATAGIKTPATIDFLKSSPKRLLINGKSVAAKSGKTFETVNPANEEILALIAEGDKADVDDAVKAARAAFEGKWSSITPHQRSRYLYKIADLIEQNADQLAELESLDNGKPLAIREGRGHSRGGANLPLLRGMADENLRRDEPIRGDDHLTTRCANRWSCRPDNSVEFSTVGGKSWKLAPALACGNTIVLKPAEQTPLTAIRLARIDPGSRIPEGVVNIVTGFGPGAGSLHRGASRGRQGRIHRLDRGRQADSPRPLREPQTSLHSSRRQVAEHYFSRFRSGRCRSICNERRLL